MQAGRLRHRVVLQSKSVARDSYGDEIVTWTDGDTVWASIEPLRGREYTEMRQEHADVTTRIRMRQRRGVDTTMRLKWTDETSTAHYFGVEAVIHPMENRRETQLLCVEMVTP